MNIINENKNEDKARIGEEKLFFINNDKSTNEDEDEEKTVVPSKELSKGRKWCSFPCFLSILLLCACILLCIIINRLICPSVNQWDYNQLQDMPYKRKETLVSAYGKVFKFGDLYDIYSKIYPKFYEKKNGADVSHIFTIYQDKTWDVMCPGLTKPVVAFDNLSRGRRIHDDDDDLPKEVADITWLSLKENQVSELTIENKPEKIKKMLNEWNYKGENPFYVIVYDRIYDLTSYVGDDLDNIGGVPMDQRFLIPEQKDIFDNYNGEDMSAIFDKYKTTFGEKQWSKTIKCMDNLFFISTVDHRKDFKCQINKYIMLAAAIAIIAVLLIKFLVTLQFGSKQYKKSKQIQNY
ncbi:hypothetical protein BCR32DRAFT_329582 [Anaeromyces robustus]|uniref:Uncharacterized protein n=1 Tax=Anaeromyces robustus TaxID=1754192 RepID=A0A1Y1WQZ9_9FUNG|nr:hypothetical protein BCR32DRAFT_329582 [Anaeromyces robustus]|eukprot:ORX75951.1 hypothetical protein BCR32DRAFT_329582 [Anaeromyces robustus]